MLEKLIDCLIHSFIHLRVSQLVNILSCSNKGLLFPCRAFYSQIVQMSVSFMKIKIFSG